MTTDLLNELLLHSTENEIPLPQDIELDGTLRRYCRNGSRNKDEWYIGWDLGDFIYCTYGSWSQGSRYTFQSHGKTLTPEQSRQLEVAKQKAAEELKQQQQEAIKGAHVFWENAQNCDTSEYLQRKGIKPHEVKKTLQNGLEWILVPIYDYSGNLISIERIAPDGTKRSFSGAPKRAGWYEIGKPTKRIRVCEGFATAASVHEGTGDLSVCCFGLGNMDIVITLLKDKYPKSKISICGDKGSEETTDKIAKEQQVAVYYPKGCEGKDFNDLHVEKGLKAVKEQLTPYQIPHLGIHDLCEMDIEPPKPIIENLFFENSLYFVYGAPGSCKSLFAMEMAFALAENKKRNVFLKYFVSQKRKVLYLDSELHISLIMKRIEMISDRRQSEIDNEDLRFITRHQLEQMPTPLNLFDPRSRELMDDLIQDFDVIIIDNFQNTTMDTEMRGLENEASQWQMIYLWMRQWMNLGKTFFIVHHEGKTGTMRGTSRMHGDADDRVRITRPKEFPTHGVMFNYQLDKGRQLDQQSLKLNNAHLSNEHKRTNIKYGWVVKEEGK